MVLTPVTSAVGVSHNQIILVNCEGLGGISATPTRIKHVFIDLNIIIKLIG
jgi:hypothetical protein